MHAASPNVAGAGLSVTEAQARLTADGPNALPHTKRRSPLRIILNVLREPMLALLLAGGQAVAIGEDSVPDAFRELAAAGVMASAPEPFDPMEKAFHALAKADLRKGETLPGAGRKLIRSYPLSAKLLAISQVWDCAGGKGGHMIAAKGAPEAIADLCHLDGTARAAMLKAVDAMAARGLRVLGVAEASFAGQTLPPDQHDFDFRFLGLGGLADPLRTSVPAAVAQCKSAGIRVIMITGDYPATALAIAKDAGLAGIRSLTARLWQQ